MDGSTASGYLGPGLRAAALLELRRRGRIAEEGGKVVAVHGHRGPARPTPGTGARAGAGMGAGGGSLILDDPILTRVLEQVEGSTRRRSWRHWIGKDNRQTTRCARDYLEAGRWIRVERTRVL